MVHRHRPVREDSLIFALIVGLTACDREVPHLGETACADATARYGESVCVARVDDLDTWATVTTPGEAADQVRATKFLMPYTEEAPLPTVIANSNTFALHYDMMTLAFPDQFGGWTQNDYSQAVLDPERKILQSGNLNEYIALTGGTFYGFTVWDSPANAASTVTYPDVLAVFIELQDRFTLGDLVFVPNSTNQREAVLGWPTDRPFAVRGDP